MSPITLDYSGRVALVTGAAQGIGEASALLLARAGFSVVVADLDEAGAQDTVAQIESAGGTAAAIRTDVGDAEQVEQMVDFALETYGRLDAAVNNAAIPQRYALTGPDASTVDNMGIDEWHELVRVNLNGPFYCTRFEIRAMKRNDNGGSIVNLSSSGAAQALEGMAGYCATKKGVIGLTETAAIENGRHNIRVNAVLPGRARTKMNVETMRDDNPEAERRLDATAPMNRAALPSELGEAILWLCTDGSSYVTGHALVVDGGTTIRHARSGWS
jgi:NAD(P)-dependent dehydrogenase (short-subunit alcohol dehydrogenase family)